LTGEVPPGKPGMFNPEKVNGRGGKLGDNGIFWATAVEFDSVPLDGCSGGSVVDKCVLGRMGVKLVLLETTGGGRTEMPPSPSTRASSDSKASVTCRLR
jgi:hypothetical protein